LSSEVRIRPAERADVGQIFAWIVDLAEYERSPGSVAGTPERLARALFGEPPSAEALIAEVGAEPAGFALFYRTFSTWECRPGLWLEDLYVPPERRRSGVGGALLAHLAGLTIERGYARLEWAALDWNAPALEFYDKVRAKRLTEWSMHRLDGETLAAVARGTD
jgi:GNAT superfamily N-acetyltransferase